jgi:zinc finger SWIM domain-containing protein 3
VNLSKRVCTCGEFQEYLIPCCHAVAVCLWLVEDLYEYVDQWYSLKYYRLTYSRVMSPIRKEDLVEEHDECNAPELGRQRGRPKKSRYRRGEKMKKLFCRHCGQQSHNRRSCRNAIQAQA